MIAIIVTLVSETLQMPEFKRSMQCLRNLKQVTAGISLYREDWDDVLPPADNWAQLTSAYAHQNQRNDQPNALLYRCPDSTAPFSYEFNVTLGSMHSARQVKPETLVMLFEANARSFNAYGGKTDQIHGRHVTDHYAFSDGHVSAAGDEIVVWTPRLSSRLNK